MQDVSPRPMAPGRATDSISAAIFFMTVNFSTGYLIEGDKMVLDEPLEGTILGNAISIASLELNTLGESTVNVCADPITVHNFSGVTSAGGQSWNIPAQKIR